MRGDDLKGGLLSLLCDLKILVTSLPEEKGELVGHIFENRIPPPAVPMSSGLAVTSYSLFI
jgi:hypothetical protein